MVSEEEPVRKPKLDVRGIFGLGSVALLLFIAISFLGSRLFPSGPEIDGLQAVSNVGDETKAYCFCSELTCVCPPGDHCLTGHSAFFKQAIKTSVSNEVCEVCASWFAVLTGFSYRWWFTFGFLPLTPIIMATLVSMFTAPSVLWLKLTLLPKSPVDWLALALSLGLATWGLRLTPYNSSTYSLLCFSLAIWLWCLGAFLTCFLNTAPRIKLVAQISRSSGRYTQHSPPEIEQIVLHLTPFQKAVLSLSGFAAAWLFPLPLILNSCTNLSEGTKFLLLALLLSGIRFRNFARTSLVEEQCRPFYAKDLTIIFAESYHVVERTSRTLLGTLPPDNVCAACQQEISALEGRVHALGMEWHAACWNNEAQ